LSHRLQHLIGALEDCMLRSGTERVIGYLLNRLPADAAKGGGTVTLPTKKGIIASQLNLTHEHFSRILRDLATGGLIAVEGRNVRLPDIGRLHARLNGVA
jgi:CRP-like cAMP-binding protein